jgi:hypothetical protein
MLLPSTSASAGITFGAKSFLISGGTGCGICVLAFLVWFLSMRRKKKEVKDEEDDDEALEQTVNSYKDIVSPPRSKWAHFVKLVAIAVFTVIGLSFLQIIPLWSSSEDFYVILVRHFFNVISSFLCDEISCRIRCWGLELFWDNCVWPWQL